MDSRKVEPIRPSEAKLAKQKTIPWFVIQAFNDAIVANLINNSAKVDQNDVVSRIIEISGDVSDGARYKIFSNQWLEVEELYAQNGWFVDYDKPGYNEDYGAFFTFSIGSRK